MSELSTPRRAGRARMVDVSAKGETVRVATARGRVLMRAGDAAADPDRRRRPRATCWPWRKWPA